MSADLSGPPAPQASVNAPRAGGGPKRPPRPARAETTTTEPPPGFAATATIERAEVSEAPMPQVPPTATPAPAAVKTGRRGRRGRRVKRVIRRIDLWSVLKLSLVVYACLYFSILATLAAVWGLLYSSGNIDKLQSFLEDVGLENFTFYGNQMFRACAAIGAVGVMAATVVTVLATALVNVISEMTGGIRVIVIEEDVDAPV